MEKQMMEEKAAVMMVATIAGAVSFWGIIYGWGRWLTRPRTEARRDTVDQDARLQRIEHAVEAIAIEVERLGEGQRYTTRLLSERERLQQAIVSPPATHVRSITPH